MEVVKSNAEADYTELIQVEAVCERGEQVSAAGTLLGKGNTPRLVALNGREVEATPRGFLLVYENLDQPGVIGMVGTLMGHERINIAAMSISRMSEGGTALTVLNLDSEPAAVVLAELRSHPAIRQAVLAHL
jgi:D-3-phosphoglycerate dehydrogenase